MEEGDGRDEDGGCRGEGEGKGRVMANSNLYITAVFSSCW